MTRYLHKVLFVAVVATAACGVSSEPDGADGPDGANDPALAVSPSAIPPGQHRVHLVISGSGTGEVEVWDDTGIVQTCNRTCNVNIADGAQVELRAFTPSQFLGFTGGCATPEYRCFVTLSANLDVAAEFELDDREVVAILPSEPVNGVAFASDGNLLVATDTDLSKYRLDGKLAWRKPIDGGVFAVATDNAGRIYAGNATSLFAMSPAGSVLWTQPVGVGKPERGLFSMMSGLQITPDGSVIAVLNGGVQTFHRNGTPRVHIDAGGGIDGFAIAPDGSVTFGVLDDVEPSQLDLFHYSVDGTLLSPPTLLVGDDHASFTCDANGNLGWLTGGFGHIIGETSPALQTIWAQRSSLRDFTSPHGLAFDASNNLVAAYSGNAGIVVEQYSPTGTLLYHTVKIDNGPFASTPIPAAIASDRGKRIAVAGDFTFRPWISVYQLP